MRNEMDRRMNGSIFSRHAPLLKVCGITSWEDAEASVEYGANALGFNFYPSSPRFVDHRVAEGILNRLPEEVMSIAVIVCRAGEPGWIDASSESNTRPRLDLSVFAIPGSIDIVQIHGLRGGDVPGAEKPLLVAVSPRTAIDFADHDIIIDTSWGRGEQADWGEVAKLERDYVLSGGLNPENIGDALRRVNPAGIDVCSGVEAEPGRKDHAKLRLFLERAADYYRVARGN